MLIHELQRDALDPNTKVTDLVRKALLVATKLGQEEFRGWAQRELNGYMDKTPCPGYRLLHGVLKAHNPYRGWMPVLIEDAALSERLSQRHAGQSIGEIESILASPGDELTMPLPQEWLNQVFSHSEGYHLGMIPTLHVDKHSLTGVLEAVRTIVLNWSLRLEKEGVLGDGMSFSREEMSRATHVTYNIGTFSGVIGDVTNSTVQIGDYNAIRRELIQSGIGPADRAELETVLDSAKTAGGTERKALAVRGLAWVAKHGDAVGALSDTLRGWFEALRNAGS